MLVSECIRAGKRIKDIDLSNCENVFFMIETWEKLAKMRDLATDSEAHKLYIQLEGSIWALFEVLRADDDCEEYIKSAINLLLRRCPSRPALYSDLELTSPFDVPPMVHAEEPKISRPQISRPEPRPAPESDGPDMVSVLVPPTPANRANPPIIMKARALLRRTFPMAPFSKSRAQLVDALLRMNNMSPCTKGHAGAKPNGHAPYTCICSLCCAVGGISSPIPDIHDDLELTYKTLGNEYINFSGIGDKAQKDWAQLKTRQLGDLICVPRMICSHVKYIMNYGSIKVVDMSKLSFPDLWISIIMTDGQKERRAAYNALCDYLPIFRVQERTAVTKLGIPDVGAKFIHPLEKWKELATNAAAIAFNRENLATALLERLDLYFYVSDHINYIETNKPTGALLAFKLAELELMINGSEFNWSRIAEYVKCPPQNCLFDHNNVVDRIINEQIGEFYKMLF